MVDYSRLAIDGVRSQRRDTTPGTHGGPSPPGRFFFCWFVNFWLMVRHSAERGRLVWLFLSSLLSVSALLAKSEVADVLLFPCEVAAIIFTRPPI